MASFWSNRGMTNVLDSYFRGQNTPSAFKMVLITNDTPPTVDTATLSGLTEIANGNGYTTGGLSISRNTTDFDTITQNDTDNNASVQLKDISWTASGALPASGNPIRWALLVDTAGTPNVIAIFDIGQARTFASGAILTMQDVTLTLENI